MAQSVFPSSPTLNQIHTILGRDWKWNGFAWDLLGDGGVNYTRRSDYIISTDTSEYGLGISYQGFAFYGSSEVDTVWTITKITTSGEGDIISATQTENWAWSDRYSL